MREPKWVDLDKAFEKLGEYPGVGQDQKVLRCIALHTDKNGNAILSDYEIAKETGLTETEVNESKQRLTAKIMFTVRPEDEETE